MKAIKYAVYGVGLYQVTSPLVALAQSYYLQQEQGTSSSSFKTNGERLRSLYGNDGPAYALVTGSSDGMGRVLALQLANYGFNLVLVSRSEAKLAQVKEECLRLNP
jgi:hypothetical protein